HSRESGNPETTAGSPLRPPPSSVSSAFSALSLVWVPPRSPMPWLLRSLRSAYPLRVPAAGRRDATVVQSSLTLGGRAYEAITRKPCQPAGRSEILLVCMREVCIPIVVE